MRAGLDDQRVSHRIKLAALWASLTLCYIYCDYFELYQPGKLQSMLAGSFGPMGPTTQSTLLLASVLLLVPALMIALCTVLPARTCRAANVVFGILYTLVMLAVIPGAWYFYKMYAVIEIGLSAAIVWLALRWPAAASSVADAGG